MYTMSYFFDQDQTLRIAKGEDLFHFKDCNQNRPVLDLRPLGNIIRDPYILKDAQGIYRLFFTDNWYSMSATAGRRNFVLTANAMPGCCFGPPVFIP